MVIFHSFLYVYQRVTCDVWCKQFRHQVGPIICVKGYLKFAASPSGAEFITALKKACHDSCGLANVKRPHLSGSSRKFIKSHHYNPRLCRDEERFDKHPSLGGHDLLRINTQKVECHWMTIAGKTWPCEAWHFCFGIFWLCLQRMSTQDFHKPVGE